MLSTAIIEFEIINGDYPTTLDELLNESKGGPFLGKKDSPQIHGISPMSTQHREPIIHICSIFLVHLLKGSPSTTGSNHGILSLGSVKIYLASLIEVILVLVVIVIISGIALPNLSGSYGNAKLRSTASNIERLGRYARGMATSA